MSAKAFTDFVKAITTANNEPARQSALAAKIGNYDKNLTGEEKGLAVVKALAQVAKEEGFDVDEKDVLEYMRMLKTQYEVNPMVAAMMDSYCSSTCHLATQVGSNT